MHLVPQTQYALCNRVSGIILATCSTDVSLTSTTYLNNNETWVAIQQISRDVCNCWGLFESTDNMTVLTG